MIPFEPPMVSDDEKSHQEFHQERRIDATDDIGGKRSAQAGKPRFRPQTRWRKCDRY
jgi:hypothetical protein